MIWIPITIGFLILFSLAYAAMSGAPWVPTWKRDIRRLEKLLYLKDGEKFYELGCGDGRVTMFLSVSGACVTGVELSFLQWGVAQIRRLLSRRKNIRFLLRNAFHVDLCDADAVYLFLMPEAYEKIRFKLEDELKPGCRVVTYVWPMPGWEYEVLDKVEGAPDLFLYVR